MRIATYDEIADQLTDGYWEWLGGARHSFDVAPGDTLTADITGLTPEEQQLACWALEAWTNVTGIKVRFVTSGAHITFDHDVGETTALGSGGAIALQAPGRADAGQAAQQQQASRHHMTRLRIPLPRRTHRSCPSSAAEEFNWTHPYPLEFEETQKKRAGGYPPPRGFADADFSPRV